MVTKIQSVLKNRAKFPKKRRILNLKWSCLAGFMSNCCSLGFFIHVYLHVNFINRIVYRSFMCDGCHLSLIMT